MKATKYQIETVTLTCPFCAAAFVDVKTGSEFLAPDSKPRGRSGDHNVCTNCNRISTMPLAARTFLGEI